MTIRWLSNDYPMIIQWLSWTFDLFFLMIIDLKRSKDRRWLFKSSATFILRWSCSELDCEWNSVLRDQVHCGSLVEKPCCRETEEKADLAPLGIMSVVQSGKPRHLRLQDNPPNNTSAQPAKSCTRRDVVFFYSKCLNLKRSKFVKTWKEMISKSNHPLANSPGVWVNSLQSVTHSMK